MTFQRAALAVVVGLLAITAATAQTGGLKVVVYDENKSTLPGAIVTLSHGVGQVKTTSIPTDPDGVALFPVLRPGGGYTIDVTFSGYSPQTQSDIRVTTGSLRTVEIVLIPEIALSQAGIPFYLGGTSLLIVVNVTMDTVSQIQSHLIAHQYGDLIKKAKLKGGRRR